MGTNEKYNALQIGLENTIVFETRACDKMEEIRLNLKEFYAVYKGVEFKIYDAVKIEMEFQGLKELMKAFEDAASDEDIKEVNQKIVKQSEPVVKNIMSGKIPKSADIKLSGRGFGSKSSVTSHAADSIPLGAVKVKDTGASADVGWEKSDNSEHFYVKFINWGTIYRPPQEFIYATGREADAELQKIAEQEYQSYLDNTLK